MMFSLREFVLEPDGGWLGGAVLPGLDGFHHSTQHKNRTIVLFSPESPVECTPIRPRWRPRHPQFLQESCS
jgi:hypothetical protein